MTEKKQTVSQRKKSTSYGEWQHFAGMLEGIAVARDALLFQYEVIADPYHPSRAPLWEAIVTMDGLLQQGAEELRSREVRWPRLKNPFPRTRPVEDTL
ncbi:hypothetical protein [Klenkia soli]|uniref:hypothetical protein n=1 Tax=Klenkia soli TaxID=1052260 RepID=UPI0010426A06|nr:hypothetical protein [Klenkia soli]